MKHKSPKQLRKKKQNPYILEGGLEIFTVLDSCNRSGADRLPPYEEYRPNKIHVARRRRAWEEHTKFPRGWTIVDETGDTSVLDAVGVATIRKISSNIWLTDKKKGKYYDPNFTDYKLPK